MAILVFYNKKSNKQVVNYFWRSLDWSCLPNGRLTLRVTPKSDLKSPTLLYGLILTISMYWSISNDKMVIKSYSNGFNCLCHGVRFAVNLAGMTLSVYWPFNPLDETVRKKQHTKKKTKIVKGINFRSHNSEISLPGSSNIENYWDWSSRFLSRFLTKTILMDHDVSNELDCQNWLPQPNQTERVYMGINWPNSLPRRVLASLTSAL